MNTDRFFNDFSKSMKKDILLRLSVLTGVTTVVLTACEKTGITDFVPGIGPNNVDKPKETSPTKESEIYTTTFKWLSSNDETIQDLSERTGVRPELIGGYEIEIDGIISADGPRKETLKFTHYYDDSGTFVAGMHTPQNPEGELMYYELIDEGDGLFVVNKGVQRNGNSQVILKYPASAMSDLKQGLGATIKFFPPDEIAAFLPSLAEGDPLIVIVPPHSNVQAVDDFLFPSFLDLDSSSEETNIQPSDEFNAIQEHIAQSEIYTLNANGQIEMQTSESMIIIPEILVLPDGTMTVTHNGDTFEADASTVVIDGQKITFKDNEGRNWVFNGESLNEEVREFVPANDITLRLEGGAPNTLHINEKTDKQDVYEDMTVWFFNNYNGLPENKELKTKVGELVANDPSLAKFKDIGPSSDYDLRVEFMNLVLKTSGGLLTISNHKAEKFEVDFNQTPEIVVEKVNEVDTDHKVALYVDSRKNDTRTGVGINIRASQSGVLTLSIQYRDEILASQDGKDQGLYGSLSNALIVYIGREIFRDINSDLYHTDLYYFSTSDPSSPNFYYDAKKHRDLFIFQP